MGMPLELNDALGCCHYADLDHASDLTDTENDEEYDFAPRVLERVVPLCSKRTYGVFLDSGAVPERRTRSRIDEQLELLRAAIPNSCTGGNASILSAAFEYIEELQAEVEKLQDEIDTESCCGDDLSSCEDEERPVDSNAALETSCGCSHPTVEVVRTEGGLRIHIQCEKRPGLLVDIMMVLEASWMNVDQITVAYEDHFELDSVMSKVDGNDAADSRQVEARLRSLISS